MSESIQQEIQRGIDSMPSGPFYESAGCWEDATPKLASLAQQVGELATAYGGIGHDMDDGVRQGDIALESSFIARDVFAGVTEGSQAEQAAYLNNEQGKLVERAGKVFVPARDATDLFNDGYTLLRQAAERFEAAAVRAGQARDVANGTRSQHHKANSAAETYQDYLRNIFG